MPIICDSYISQGNVAIATDGTGENTIGQGRYFGQLCFQASANYGSTPGTLYWDVKVQGGYTGSGGMWMIFVEGRANANRVANAYIVALSNAYQRPHDMWGYSIFGNQTAMTIASVTARTNYDYTFSVVIDGTNGGGRVSVIQMLQIGPTVQYVQISSDNPN
jgi:hypothetical protein|tara:strand:+ start:40 stop:525 length:486 start_codon:yes stop_codon:yes gene_type:complete